VKKSQIPGWISRVLKAAVLLALACAACLHFARSATIPPAGKELSSEGQTLLRNSITAGNLPDLRWPDFSDYTKHVQKFYDLGGYALWWIRGGAPTPQARQMIALMLQADQKGLSAEDYDGPRWSDRLAKLSAAREPAEADLVRFDLALTVCAMRYVSDLHIGRISPKRFSFGLDEESRKYDLPEFFKERIVAADDVGKVLAGVEPPYPGYRRTMQALQTYVELAKKDDGEQLPSIRKTVAPGDTYAGVPRLARLLRLVGDLPANVAVPTDALVYSEALADAVRNFQRRLGRDPNGRIDQQTLADLNVPLSRRVRQMQLTLERWRWLPDSYQKEPVVVNIPEFHLRTYDQDFNTVVTMNVVVGRAYGHDTPVFSDTMEYVVFRPYWEVPYSIIKAEMIPHISRDPDYLTKNALEIVDDKQVVVSEGTIAPDLLEQLRAGKLFVRQKPGPKNALGLVKFLFPNSYNVYMHDTPATELFAKSRRDFSHGCIRLERPADLAAWVLRDNPGWTPERIRDALNGTSTQQIKLAHPVPVLIVYATVIVLEDGHVHFYDDIYGHDAALEKALAKGYPYL
jgi:L,D-transpeptidase YcbB